MRFVLLAALLGCSAGREAADAAPPDAPPGNLDPCPQTPACPAVPAGYGAGDGLRVIDRCAFPLADGDTWAARAAIVDALPATAPRVTLADVAADLNRTAVRIAAADVPGDAAGIRTAFTWQAGDQDVAYWIPQGLTASFDGGGSSTDLLLVSWYYDRAEDPGSTAEKGVRIAIADVSDPANVRYRFALLVEPVMRDGQPDFAPIEIHAGGLAWFGDLLYVPDTGNGFRVFDLARIHAVDPSQDRLGRDPASGAYHAHGYRYVIPQVGTYTETGACAARFSFVALDRSTTPPTLLSGEYDAASAGGRLYRWPLDPLTGRLALTDRARVIADGAWFAGETHVQGALSYGDTFWMSSSAPAGGGGALYRARVDTPSTTLGWIDTPEDLAFDPAAGSLWSLSEGLGARYVISVALTPGV